MSAKTTDRTYYSFEKKALIRAKYKLCKSPKDRTRLAEEHHVGKLLKMYNLASRLNATSPHAGVEGWAADDGYRAEKDYARLYLRDSFEDLEWSKDDDRIIREHFGKSKIEEIGVLLSRSETAVAYRARVLGLRNIPKYYDIKKVAPWLGIRVSDMISLKRFGLEVFPCCDSAGKVQIILVSTTSLARCLLAKGLWKRLVDRFDADEFFIRDVIESIISLQKDEAVWEPSPWVSHGHTSLNPYSKTCFGLFFNGNDLKMIGDDLDPRDLSPAVGVTGDNWRRGANGLDTSEEDIYELDTEVAFA